MKFENAELKDVYRIAKEGGLKVYTTQNPEKETITYFWITNGTQLVYCQRHYSGVKFSSEHQVQNGSGLGTGFGLTNNEPVVVNGIDELEEYFTYRPAWTRRHAVKGYENWEAFAKRNTPLSSDYIEL